MGKTKTAFIGEIQGGEKSSLDKLKEKRERQAKERPEKVHIAGLKGGQRIKMIESEEVKEDTKILSEKDTKQKPKKQKARGKKYQSVKAKIDKSKIYSLPEALKLVKETSYSKFDGTMELHLVVKKTGISAQVTLPYSTGKTKKVEIASDTTIKKLENLSAQAGGKIDFDILLAAPEMMPKLIPFAKILGPKGLMPNPKNGTLIKSAKEAEKFSGNTVNLKTEKEAPLIHTVIGKVSQKDEELIKNAESILGSLSGSKQIVKAYIKATMSPAIRLKVL
mgnify:CR=1 FL=1